MLIIKKRNSLKKLSTHTGFCCRWLTVCPVKTAVRPAFLRDFMDFMWDIRDRSLSGGFR